jgi:hypothetical protein
MFLSQTKDATHLLASVSVCCLHPPHRRTRRQPTLERSEHLATPLGASARPVRVCILWELRVKQHLSNSSTVSAPKDTPIKVTMGTSIRISNPKQHHMVDVNVIKNVHVVTAEAKA